MNESHLRQYSDLNRSRNYSEVEAKAVEWAHNTSPFERSFIVRSLIPFFHNESIPDRFRQQQLEYWLEMPGELQVKFGANRWQDVLLWDDWTKTGQPHILPDGSPGPGHHYSLEKEPNFDGDAFLPRWYNGNYRVFDVEASGPDRTEWAYLGPETGTDNLRGPFDQLKVGKLGSHPEFAEDPHQLSIARDLPPEVTPQSLVGHKIAVLQYDWFGGAKPDPSALTEIQDRYAESPISNSDGTKGIEVHFMMGQGIEGEPRTTQDEASAVYDRQMPDKYHLVVDYLLYVQQALLDGESVGGLTIGGGAMVADYQNPNSTAYVTLHEFGHLNGLSHKYDAKDGDMTVMGTGGGGYLDREWEVVKKNLSLVNCSSWYDSSIEAVSVDSNKRCQPPPHGH